MKHAVRLLAYSEIFNHANLLVRRLKDVLLISVSCSVETVRVICSVSDVFFTKKLVAISLSYVLSALLQRSVQQCRRLAVRATFRRNFNYVCG